MSMRISAAWQRRRVLLSKKNWGRSDARFAGSVGRGAELLRLNRALRHAADAHVAAPHLDAEIGAQRIGHVLALPVVVAVDVVGLADALVAVQAGKSIRSHGGSPPRGWSGG